MPKITSRTVRKIWEWRGNIYNIIRCTNYTAAVARPLMCLVLLRTVEVCEWGWLIYRGVFG